jgi:hypothetical protein
LEAGNLLQQLIEFVARRLLDPAPVDPFNGIGALGLGLRQGASSDDDCGLWRFWG